MALRENQPRIRIAGVGPPGLRLAPALARIVHEHSWFIALALLYLLAGYTLTWAYDRDFSLFLYSRSQLSLYLTFVIAFIVYRVVRTIITQRPERPLGVVWADLMGDSRLPDRILNAVPALLLLPLILSSFTSLKRLIPHISPFEWDAPLAKIDADFHGGTHPWELLQPLIGYPSITSWIDFAYGPPWFWMLVFMQFWQTFTLDLQRMRFLLSFLLCWALLGNLMAMGLSSAGPVYFDKFVDGTNPFASLFVYLGSVAESSRLLALNAQNYLWQTYVNDDLTVGVGISAMPSMHIAMGFLFFLLTLRLHWALRLVAGAYVVLLLIGSVHLGWHYAIDGYVSIICTYAIWWAVGRALDWRARRRREWVDVDITPG